MVTSQVKGAVCWEPEYKVYSTIEALVRYVHFLHNDRIVHSPSGAEVKTSKLLGNQQVTDGVVSNNALTGTSEAERSQTLKFNEWLAGLIDGDGCFVISKEGYTSCEITAGLLDEPMLHLIKDQFLRVS